MITLKQVHKEIIDSLYKARIDTPDLDARFIIEERTSYDWSDIIASPGSIISDSQYKNILADIIARANGKPLSRIYGVREFWSLPFEISSDTLDPRPDTELIIDLALQRFLDKEAPISILDLGTGSGCILIALLTEFPNAQGCGVDVSFAAMEIAKKNAIRNHVDSRAQFICGSWFEKVEKKFDLIVSNPPYISNQVIQTLPKEVKNHDPILALDGGGDGLDPYKIIFPQLKNYLNSGGSAFLEIGHEQDKDVMRLAENTGFMQRTVHLDLAGNPRVVDISSGDK